MLLRTFGGLSIQADGPPPSGAATQRRRLALLAVVAASGERGISRDKLLALLWPDSDAERGRGALAQALYALRRDLGGESLFLGTSELRLNPDILPSDVGQFRDALAAGRLEAAAELYAGTFLDGFHLPDAAEFERWVESERSQLKHRFAGAAEQLATAAEQRGDVRSAAIWWRRLAAHDPLDATVAGGLIRTLAAAGDRAGALRQARVYEALLREELDLDPDPAIVALVERIRSAPPEPEAAAPIRPAAAVPATTPAPTPSAEPAAPPVDLAAVTTAEWRARRPARPQWLDSAAVLIAIIAFSLAVLLVLLLLPPRDSTADTSAPVIAVGQFRSFPAGGDPAGEVTLGPLSDMLATSLARIPGVRVVSNARIEELVARSGAGGGAAYAAAAREAGASELIEGAIFNLGGGLLRLDLREVDLTSGTVRRATSIEGHDLVALVEQGAAEIAAGLGATGVAAPGEAVTSSVLAARLYRDGLRLYYRGDLAGAHQLFESALGEDSLFAMAQFYSALSFPGTPVEFSARMQRALRLAARTSDRERLIIASEWASYMDDPVRLALAETLAVRYPAEAEGRLRLGQALVWSGRPLEAIRELRRAVSMDSASLTDSNALRCIACEAMSGLVGAYTLADSFAAAERAARARIEAEPRSPYGWVELSSVLAGQERYREAETALKAAAELAPATDFSHFRMLLALRTGDFAAVDARLAQMAERSRGERGTALFWLTTSRRMQGRLREALASAREYRATGSRFGQARAAAYEALPEAQVRFEMGELRTAAALFDSIGRLARPGDAPSRAARHRAWTMALVATPLAALGDTARLARLADSLPAVARLSGYGRDRLLHHHVRGLLLQLAGRHAEAAEAFRLAVFSPTVGYTRSNYERARSLLAVGRPRDAITSLQAALRGPFDAANLYVTFTDLHELLAHAWEAAGEPDSALVHYRWVARAWENADPAFAERRESVRERIERADSRR